MQLSTKTCSAHNHPEFILDVEGTIVKPALKFLRSIEDMVAAGEVFKLNDTLSVGWMIAQVWPHDRKTFTLYEPDMKSFPLKFVPGVNESILQMTMQMYTLDSFAISRDKMEFPSIKQSAVVCDRIGVSRELYLARSEPANERDSGWFIGCAQDDHDHHDKKNLKRLSLYEAFLQRREIQNWMAFPQGSMILARHDAAPRVWLNDQPLPVKSGSFVAKWLTNQ
ncbi:MAG TPA: hypothetical protein VKX17_16330 [Planctomycetota bacterium]|nr:hypothetical protein [Planctomycetota bacterium]